MATVSRAGLAIFVFASLSLCAAGQDTPAPTPPKSPPPTKPATKAPPVPPAWSLRAVWYVIDVPRFHNGDPSNDPAGTVPWTTKWLARADKKAGEALDARAYGGDLQGVAARLPYLADLGVNTLYLTNVFARRRGAFHVDESIAVTSAAVHVGAGEAEDVWRFDTADRALLTFIEKAHEHTMRVVLTAPASFDTRDEIVAFIAASRRWMDPDNDGDPEDGVDGWVVENPGADAHTIWTQWRKKTKKLNPEILLVVDSEAPRPWLEGDTFDVAVGHERGSAIVDFFAAAPKPGSLKRLTERLFSRAASMPAEHIHASPVPLSTNRRGRVLTALAQWRAKDDENRNADVSARWRLATILQYFVSGAPMISYGDEVGILGGPGPASRAPMWWPDLSSEASVPKKYRGDFASIVRWLDFRRGLWKPLQRGRLSTNIDDARGLLVVSRRLPGDEVYLVLNTSEKKQQVLLRAGRPGQLIGMISPHLVPADRRGRPLPPRPPTLAIYPLREGGNRQFVADDGTIPLWVDAKSVRIVLVKDEEPRRAPKN